MGSPSPREKQLMAFLGTLPADMAGKLYEACDAARQNGDDSLPFDLICDALRPAEPDLSEHILFGPAAPLVTEDAGAPAAGAILKSSLEPFEAFARSAAGAIVSDLESGARSRIAGRGVLGAALVEVFDAKMEDPDGRNAFIKMFGGERGAADARKMITLLCAEPELSENLYDLPDYIKDIDDDMLAALRACHEAVVAKEPRAELLLMFLLMERLDQHWMILRVAKAISNKQDDLLFSRTEFSVIGEMLLDEAAEAVRRLQLDSRTAVEPDKVIGALDGFAAITQGMTRELGIRKDGEWGKRLHKIRHDAASNMEDMCRETPDAIDKALPLRRVKLDGNIPANRPDTSRKPKPEIAERAVALCDVLRRCRSHANAAAFASARVRMFEEAERRLDDYSASLIDVIHEAGAEEMQNLKPWIALTGRAILALSGEDSHAVFQRRASAAAGKSSQDAA